jgi:hypothetical protein
MAVAFVMDKVALRQVFSKYFGFPCQSSFHNRPVLAAVPSGLSLTLLRIIIINITESKTGSAYGVRET